MQAHVKIILLGSLFFAQQATNKKGAIISLVLKLAAFSSIATIGLCFPCLPTWLTAFTSCLLVVPTLIHLWNLGPIHKGVWRWRSQWRGFYHLHYRIEWKQSTESDEMNENENNDNSDNNENNENERLDVYTKSWLWISVYCRTSIFQCQIHGVIWYLLCLVELVDYS